MQLFLVNAISVREYRPGISLALFLFLFEVELILKQTPVYMVWSEEDTFCLSGFVIFMCLSERVRNIVFICV